MLKRWRVDLIAVAALALPVRLIGVLGGKRRAAPTHPERELVPAAHRSFPCFDGLRAIAAVSVIFVHTAFPSGFSTENHRWGAFTARLEIGVAVFFLISGFLLYRPFVAAHLAARPGPAIKPYLKRRILRIVPAYWVALVFAAFVFHSVTQPISSVQSAVVYFGFLQIYSSHYILHGISAAWTLCVEMSFYAFLPAYALVVRRWAHRPLRAELLGVGGLFIASVLYKVAIFFTPTTQQTGAGTWLPAQLDLFALGMALAVASVWWTEHRPEPVILRARWLPAVSWALALASFWAVSEAGLPRIPIYTETVGQVLTRQELYAAFAFFLLLPAVFGPQDKGWVRRFLQSRPLVLTGVVSYGIYLWHETWMLEVLKWTHQRLFTLSFATLSFDVCALTAASAVASYLLVEQPFQRLGRRRRRAPAAAPPTPALEPVGVA